jgi:hypothetical protein
MYGQLARLRLRWYFRASGELVLRHWQWLALACLIVPGPPVVSLFLHAASFLVASVSPGLGRVQHLLVALTIDLGAVLWILPQRYALSGGAFMRYAGALPLPRNVRLCVEATLLVVANSAILVTACIAAAHMLAPPCDPYALCCFLVFLVLAAIAQHAVLTRHFIDLLGIILSNSLLAAGLTGSASNSRWVLLFAAIGSVGASALAGSRLRRAGTLRRLGQPSVAAGLRVLTQRTPATLIQCKAILERPAQAIFRIGAAIALALGTVRLMAIFDFDGRTFPTAILAMAVICLLLAGLYRTLADARRAMASYLATLPLPPHYWPLHDTRFVLLLNCVPLIILLCPQIMNGLLSLFIIFGLAVAYQVLLALLRWPVVHGGRHSLLYGVLLTAVWSGAAIAAVSR